MLCLLNESMELNESVFFNSIFIVFIFRGKIAKSAKSFKVGKKKAKKVKKSVVSKPFEAVLGP